MKTVTTAKRRATAPTLQMIELLRTINRVIIQMSKCRDDGIRVQEGEGGNCVDCIEAWLRF